MFRGVKNFLTYLESAIENKPESNRLFDAIENGHRGQIISLIEGGIDINLRFEDGQTPIHLATECGSEDVVRLLIEKGANIHAKNDDGVTPLHIAAVNGIHNDKRAYVEIATVLIKKGASIHVKDNNGYSPLEYVESDDLMPWLHLQAYMHRVLTTARVPSAHRKYAVNIHLNAFVKVEIVQKFAHYLRSGLGTESSLDS